MINLEINPNANIFGYLPCTPMRISQVDMSGAMYNFCYKDVNILDIWCNQTLVLYLHNLDDELHQQLDRKVSEILFNYISTMPIMDLWKNSRSSLMENIKEIILNRLIELIPPENI